MSEDRSLVTENLPTICFLFLCIIPDIRWDDKNNTVELDIVRYENTDDRKPIPFTIKVNYNDLIGKRYAKEAMGGRLIHSISDKTKELGYR